MAAISTKNSGLRMSSANNASMNSNHRGIANFYMIPSGVPNLQSPIDRLSSDDRNQP